MAKFFLRNLGILGLRAGALALAKQEDEPNDYVSEDREAVQIGALGNPVVSNVVFDSYLYKFKDEEVNFPGLTINSVLITVTQSKNIVKTTIQGRNGTVKEYISDGDYSISISGAIYSGFPNAYPTEPVENLIKVLSVPLPLEITSEYLNRFGIVTAVVESFNFPQTKGVRNFQAFNITLSSDSTAELQISEDEETIEARSVDGEETEPALI